MRQEEGQPRARLCHRTWVWRLWERGQDRGVPRLFSWYRGHRLRRCCSRVRQRTPKTGPEEERGDVCPERIQNTLR